MAFDTYSCCVCKRIDWVSTPKPALNQQRVCVCDLAPFDPVVWSLYTRHRQAPTWMPPNSSIRCVAGICITLGTYRKLFSSPQSVCVSNSREQERIRTKICQVRPPFYRALAEWSFTVCRERPPRRNQCKRYLSYVQGSIVLQPGSLKVMIVHAIRVAWGLVPLIH